MAEDQPITELPPLEDRPLVTFALFAYNQEKYIREAVEGAFAQTYEPLEIILSDDCSTDRTFEIMKEMAAVYRGPHQVRTVKNDENFGVLKHVLTRGREAQGAIVVMAAGDDISFAWRTDKLVDALKKNKNACAAYSHVNIIGEDGEAVATGVIRPINSSLPPLYLNPCPPDSAIVQGCSAAYHKSLFKIHVKPDECPLSEDVLFSFLINLYEKEVIVINEVLALYRQHSGAITNKLHNRQIPSLHEEEQNTVSTARRVKSRIACYRKLAIQREEKLDKQWIATDSRYCNIVLSWSNKSFFQRVKQLVLEILIYRGRFAKWQAGRIVGKYPNYQPKNLVCRFQTSRYRS